MDVGDEQRAITRRSGAVALGTLGSRVLGAARDAVIAAVFPLAATDAFFVAWTIPNTLRSLLGEGGVAAAFVPVFSELDEREGRQRARRYFAGYAGVLLSLLVLVCVVGVLLAPALAWLYAAGYARDEGKLALTAHLTAVAFPYVLLAGMSALLTGALNARGRFLVPAFAPAWLNIGLIASAFVLVPVVHALGWPAVAALALGALCGGVFQIAWQLPALRSVGLLTRPRLGLRDPAVRRSFALLAPLLLGTGVYQLNILLSRLLASFLPAGSQSFLYYAQRLVEIPQGVFALAVASAALPSLARLRAQERHAEALAALRHGLRLSLFIALPAAVGLAVLALPTVTVLFARGVFDMAAVAPTARALVWLALGVWAVASVHPTVRMFYAYEQTRIPVACAALNLAVFVSLGLWGMDTLAHEALALATSCAAMAQLAALLVMLRRRLGPLGLGEVARAALRSAIACAAMAGAARAVASLGVWERGGNDPRNLAVYVAAVAVAAFVYAGVSRLLRSPELSGVIDALAARRSP